MFRLKIWNEIKNDEVSMKILQNVRLKLFLTKTIFRLFSLVNMRKKHDSQLILFYINTDLRDNNEYLLSYLLKHNYNDRYRIVCSCNNPEKYENWNVKNLSFTNRFGGVKTFFYASKVFYTIGKIPIIPAKDQKVMQMWHGTPIKDASKGWRDSHTWNLQHYTYLLCPSTHYAPIFSDLFSTPMSKIFIGGYPRCEKMFLENPNYNLGEYKKLILWVPTFRKSNDQGLSEMEESNIIVPVLKQSDFEEVNNYLKSINVMVVLKLHPLQKLEGFNSQDLMNLKLLSHSEFIERHMDLYRLCAQSDAMITDYSSICFDYLLLDKPIAFTEDDLESYADGRGFAVKNPDEYKPGPRIKTKKDFLDFCADVAYDKDGYKEERERVKSLTNDYCDGQFSKRILEVMQIK